MLRTFSSTLEVQGNFLEVGLIGFWPCKKTARTLCWERFCFFVQGTEVGMGAGGACERNKVGGIHWACEPIFEALFQKEFLPYKKKKVSTIALDLLL